MDLVYDHSHGAAAVSVPCYVCNKMVRLCDALIDREGPAFRAYYHRGCLPHGLKLPEATACEKYRGSDGCYREHGGVS